MDLTAGDLSRLRRLLAAVHGEFREWSGDFPLQILAADPLDELIGTVLSQATNDRNSARAFAGLRAAFPDWEAVLAAPEEEVAASIACGGLSVRKAGTIKAILARLMRERSRLSLDFLKAFPPGLTRAYLLSLPGVGPKTAACVQLFSLGQAAFPVDTHIRRVASRLGLFSAQTGPAKAQTLIERAIAAEDCLPLHLLLIRHGRRICRAGKPGCGACALVGECPRQGLPG